MIAESQKLGARPLHVSVQERGIRMRVEWRSGGDVGGAGVSVERGSSASREGSMEGAGTAGASASMEGSMQGAGIELFKGREDCVGKGFGGDGIEGVEGEIEEGGVIEERELLGIECEAVGFVGRGLTEGDRVQEGGKVGWEIPKVTASHEGGMEWSLMFRRRPGRRLASMALRCLTNVT